ncbi:hypothetical protein JKG47_00450 [Acidithiobacillus sp. MC6.1]|nr:hypothetical protein [Acidithiobacillus sp. MC6.1]
MDQETIQESWENRRQVEDSARDEMEDHATESGLSTLQSADLQSAAPSPGAALLHLPPGLDLLFDLLDSDSRNPVVHAAPQPITPTPYPRTPTLG